MNNLFRKLPKLDILMQDKRLESCRESMNYNAFYTLVKDEIERFREDIKCKKIENTYFNIGFSLLLYYICIIFTCACQ